jgi:hypothetical protein
MKKLILLFVATVILAFTMQSCRIYGTYYDYIQMLATKPVNQSAPISQVNGGVLYEDENCAVFYKFWSDGGDAGFEFYNKTNEIIYLDLSKTFFIKNGVAYDYYQDQTVTKTKSSNVSVASTYGYSLSANRSYSGSISQYYSGNFGWKPATQFSPQASSATVGTSKSYGAMLFGAATATSMIGNSTSVSTSNSPTLAIPPKSSKFVENFSIISSEIISCDLKYYPEESDKLTFTAETSPITFGNYITFKIGENTDLQSIQNEFYVCEIANYVKQDVTEYVERKKTCENVLTPTEIKAQKHQPTIYDRYITVGDGTSFYKTYRVLSYSKLYKRDPIGYYWNSYYEGYTKGSTSTTSN